MELTVVVGLQRDHAQLEEGLQQKEEETGNAHGRHTAIRLPCWTNRGL